MTISVGDVIGLSTGGVFEISCLTIPDAPVITGVVDNGDEGGITASVTGTGTIQLYYRLKYETSWTTGESRSNSGDIVQAGLTTDSWYEVFATILSSGVTSAPSGISTVRVLGADNYIESALITLLASDDTVVGLVSTRMYPNIVPQKASMPAISYQNISGFRGHVIAGPDSTVNSRYQINCWGSSYLSAKDVSDAVREKLDGYNGTTDTVVIQSIQLIDEGDVPTISAGSDVLRRYGKRLDFMIFYKE